MGQHVLYLKCSRGKLYKDKNLSIPAYNLLVWFDVCEAQYW